MYIYIYIYHICICAYVFKIDTYRRVSYGYYGIVAVVGVIGVTVLWVMVLSGLYGVSQVPNILQSGVPPLRMDCAWIAHCSRMEVLPFEPRWHFRGFRVVF